MAKHQGIIVKGDKELIKLMDNMKASTTRKITRPAVRKAATPIRKATKDYAPKESGALKKSIKTVVRMYPKTNTVVAVTGPDKNFEVDYNGEIRKPNKYSHLVERDNPFMRKGFESQKNKAAEILKTTLWEYIKKEAAKGKK